VKVTFKGGEGYTAFTGFIIAYVVKLATLEPTLYGNFFDYLEEFEAIFETTSALTRGGQRNCLIKSMRVKNLATGPYIDWWVLRLAENIFL
jgi:hypothetical protein